MAIDLIELKKRIPVGKEHLFAKEFAEIEQLKRERVKALESLKQSMKTRGCEFFKPWKWQVELIELVHKNSVVIASSPNDIGKTTVMVNIILSWSYGYEPWTKSLERVGDDYIQVGKYWYRKSSLGIEPPVRLRVTGEDWQHSIGETINAEMSKWIIADSYTTKHNSNPSVVCMYIFKNGSTIELMTHAQDIDLYESWKGHGWAPDEPPKQNIFESMSRGITGRNGKVLMCGTPLKEAWVLNELIQPENARYDIAVMRELTFLDNETNYNHDKDLLTNAGVLPGDIDTYFKLLLAYENKSKAEHVKILNQCLKDVVPEHRFIDVISKLIYLKKVNDTSEENRDSRFKGTFKSLIGRIYKRYKDFYHPEGHLLKPFKIPTNWVVTFQIDFQQAEKMVLNFYAIDEMNRIYVIYEIFEYLSATDVAHEILRLKTANAWRLTYGEIDPLSKGDDKSLINRYGNVPSSYNILKMSLNPHGILVQGASKDKRSGIDNIRDRLSPINGIPTLFVFDNCIHHRRQFKQWGYDKFGNWDDKDDHCMETIGRVTLSGVKYTEPNEDTYVFKPDPGI